jgi:hypothetical protein
LSRGIPGSPLPYPAAACARKLINLQTAVAGLKMAHLPKIALAFEHLHHFNRPQLPFFRLKK